MKPKTQGIERKLAALRQGVRRVALLRGLCLLAACALAVAALLGTADYALRFPDRGVRILATLAIVAVAAWAGRRFLLQPLRRRLGDVDLARRVRRRFPALSERLPSAVEFLRQAEGDPLAGSAALRRAVIAEATVETERVDFTAALDAGPAWWAAAWAAGALLAVGILFAIAPRTAATAALRLLNPLNNVSWPQSGHAADPRVESLAVRLFAPAYTGWPEEKAGGNFRALEGTRVEIAAQASKPLRAAELCFDDGRRWAARLDADGTTFTVPAPVAGDPPLVVQKSVTYWFRLTDREGTAGGDDALWQIRAVADSAPSAVIERPAANLRVTSRAIVPLRITAKDDLALSGVGLVYSRSDRPQEPPVKMPLYAGPERMPLQQSSGLAENARPPEPQVIDFRWDLSDLKLAPGTRVEFFAVAGDYRGQTGKSEPRRLTVVTPEELQQGMAARQDLLAAELARLLKMQRDGRGQLKGPEIRLAELGRLAQVDVDNLQAAELNQRQVQRGLTSRAGGVPVHINALLADLENNRIDAPDVRRRLLELSAQIEKLRREQLAEIARNLLAAIKSAQVRLEDKGNATGRDAATTASLAAVARHEDQVIAVLDAMLAAMNQWEGARRFQRDLEQLLRDQEDLSRRALDLGRRTLASELKDLPPAEAADLKVLAAQQLDLAERLDRGEQDMDAAGRQFRQGDQRTADNLAAAGAEIRRLAVAAQMRAAAGQIRDNQIGQAAASQKQIAEGLRAILAILAAGRRPDVAGLVKKLKEIEPEVTGLCTRQRELRKEMEQAAGRPDAAGRLQQLAREQQQLQQQAEDIARRLERLGVEQAAAAARQAAAQMQSAAAAAAGGDAAEAGRQAAAAEKTLADAGRLLVEQRVQAQAELAAQQMARLEDAVKHLHGQQKKFLEETGRLDKLQQAEGHFSRGQLVSLRDLAQGQRGLHGETAQLAEQLAGAAPFHLALGAAAGQMVRAAGLLDGRQTGAAAQQAEQAALARLDLVQEALKAQSAAGGNSSEGGSGAKGSPPGAAGVQNLAELILVKLMQQDVNARTCQLHAAGGADEHLPPARQEQYKSLGGEQGALADMVLRAVPPREREQTPEEANPLLAIGERMQTAERRIAGNDAGPETQTLQEEIVTRLDRLIERARQAQSSPPPGNPPQPPQPAPGQPTVSRPTVPPRPATNPRPPVRPGDRYPAVRPAPRPLPDVLPQLPDWGNLSPREREQILQLPAEDFLPEYREMIEDYYRRLSQPAENGEQP